MHVSFYEQIKLFEKSEFGNRSCRDEVHWIWINGIPPIWLPWNGRVVRNINCVESVDRCCTSFPSRYVYIDVDYGDGIHVRCVRQFTVDINSAKPVIYHIAHSHRHSQWNATSCRERKFYYRDSLVHLTLQFEPCQWHRHIAVKTSCSMHLRVFYFRSIRTIWRVSLTKQHKIFRITFCFGRGEEKICPKCVDGFRFIGCLRSISIFELLIKWHAAMYSAHVTCIHACHGVWAIESCNKFDNSHIKHSLV